MKMSVLLIASRVGRTDSFRRWRQLSKISKISIHRKLLSTKGSWSRRVFFFIFNFRNAHSFHQTQASSAQQLLALQAALETEKNRAKDMEVRTRSLKDSLQMAKVKLGVKLKVMAQLDSLDPSSD